MYAVCPLSSTFILEPLMVLSAVFLCASKYWLIQILVLLKWDHEENSNAFNSHLSNGKQPNLAWPLREKDCVL